MSINHRSHLDLRHRESGLTKGDVEFVDTEWIVGCESSVVKRKSFPVSPVPTVEPLLQDKSKDFTFVSPRKSTRRETEEI